MQIKQLQTSLEKEETSGNNTRQTLFKTNKSKLINQKLFTIQQNYENNLKKVTKLQKDIKRIKKERKGEQKWLTARIDSNKKRSNP